MQLSRCRRSQAFAAFEADGRLTVEVVQLGPAAFAPPPPPPAGSAPLTAVAAPAQPQPHEPGLELKPSATDYDITTFCCDEGVLQGELPQPGAEPRPSPPPSPETPKRAPRARAPPPPWPGPMEGGEREPASASVAASKDVKRAEAPARLRGAPGRRDKGSAQGDGGMRVPRARARVPACAAEGEALLSELWRLYEAVGRRNGFTECSRAQFQQLLRVAPGVQVRASGSPAQSVLYQ
jgi:hypothetical protein